MAVSAGAGVARGSTLLLEHHGEREWDGALTNLYFIGVGD